jgi:Mg2+/Co2+ transporter CorC
MCAEQMAQRVLARHCEVIGGAHTMYPLFSRVLADEAHHVQLCKDVLRQLVAPAEAASLAALLHKTRAIDARFGVTSALVMYATGWFYWLRSLAPGALG